MPATYIFLFHRLGVGVPEAAGLEGLIVVTDLVFYVTVMPLAALILLFEAGAKPDVLHLVAVVMLVVVGAAAIVLNLGRYYRRICIGIGRQMGKVPRLARYRYRLARATVQFVRCLRLLRKMSCPQYLALSLITLGFWLPRYLLLFLIIHLVGQAVPLSYLFLVQGALNLGSQILLMPGGGGTVDAGYAAFLSPYLDRETLAFTLLVWRTYTFYWYLIVGGPIFCQDRAGGARSYQPKSFRAIARVQADGSPIRHVAGRGAPRPPASGPKSSKFKVQGSKSSVGCVLRTMSLWQRRARTPAAANFS